MELVNRVPVPARTRATRGDRAAAEADLGWSVPASVWELVEAYGASTWLDWLFAPSPYAEDGRISLANNAETVQQVEAGARLVAFADAEGPLLYAPANDDRICIVDDSGARTETGMTLPQLLSAWLAGEGPAVLAPLAKLTGDPTIPPYALPLLDEDRDSSLTRVYVRGGAAARADRWAALSRALGPQTRMSVRSEGETRQDKVHIADLELTLIYDSYSRVREAEQLHATYYDDRREDVVAFLRAAVTTAGMTIDGTQGSHGRSVPF